MKLPSNEQIDLLTREQRLEVLAEVKALLAANHDRIGEVMASLPWHQRLWFRFRLWQIAAYDRLWHWWNRDRLIR